MMRYHNRLNLCQKVEKTLQRKNQPNKPRTFYCRVKIATAFFLIVLDGVK